MADLVCVSYLAPASVLAVAAMPEPNDGAIVVAASSGVGADGPVVAAMASAHGLRTRLVANALPPGIDADQLDAYLERHGVKHDATRAAASVDVPRLIVLGDSTGNRMWLSYLPGVTEGLRDRLAAIGRPGLLYVDAYPVIEDAAVAALELAAAAGHRVFLNLSQGTASATIMRAAARCTGALDVVQAGVGDAPLSDAAARAEELRDELAPQVAVVTAGRSGAVAIDAGGPVSHAGFDVTVVHAHCAGAAFSAGFIAGLERGWDSKTTLRYACALGALRVSTSPHVEVFTPEAVEALLSG